MSYCHPSHKTEWRDSSHYEFVCTVCGRTDKPGSWGLLAEPCPGVIGVQSSQRLETGVVQEHDDWPGIFIRGDNALMHYAPAIRNIVKGHGSVYDFDTIQGLAELFESCDVSRNPNEVQHITKKRNIDS